MKNKSIASIGVAMLAATAFIGCGDDAQIKNIDKLAQLEEGVITEEQLQDDIASESTEETIEEDIEDIVENIPEMVDIEGVTKYGMPVPSVDELYETREIDGQTYHIMSIKNSIIRGYREEYMSPFSLQKRPIDNVELVPAAASTRRNGTDAVCDVNNPEHSSYLDNINYEGIYFTVYDSPSINSNIIRQTYYASVDYFDIYEQCVETNMIHIRFTDENGNNIDGWIENEYILTGAFGTEMQDTIINLRKDEINRKATLPEGALLLVEDKEIAD